MPIARLVLLAVVVLSGCSTAKKDDDHDQDHDAGPPECEAIIAACHMKDTGAGAVHDCHALAHGPQANASQCVARKDACTATCNAAPAPDAGAVDAGSGG